MYTDISQQMTSFASVLNNTHKMRPKCSCYFLEKAEQNETRGIHFVFES